MILLRRKRFLLRRDRASSALLRDFLQQLANLGPGRKLELTAAHERLLRLNLPGADHCVVEASRAKARQRLGWTPALGYRESIERTVRWYFGQESKPMPSVARASV